MRRLLLGLVLVCATAVASAQSVIVVDSEKIFKSLDEYNAALEAIDVMSEGYQAQVDAKFAEVERLFNEYAASKALYTTAQRQVAETNILAKESEATKYQEQYFAQDGAIMKRRVELVTPIQTRVFSAIDNYAKELGVDVVLDKASSSTMLYVKEGVDHTELIINKLKQ